MEGLHTLKGNWNDTKERLKQNFASEESKQDEILERLQLKLGKTKEELQKFIFES